MNPSFTSESGSMDSESKKFEEIHGMNKIMIPHPTVDKLVISVQDTGVGIKNKDRIKLFKLFGKLQSTRDMNTQGIGLGLVIS